MRIDHLCGGLPSIKENWKTIVKSCDDNIALDAKRLRSHIESVANKIDLDLSMTIGEGPEAQVEPKVALIPPPFFQLDDPACCIWHNGSEATVD